MSPDIAAKHQALVAKAREIRDRAKSENRDVTDQELSAIEKHLADANLLQADYESQCKRIRGMVGGLGQRSMDRDGPDAYRSSPSRSIIARDGSGVSFATRLFGSSGDRGGFADAGEFMGTIASGLNDNRLMAANRVGIDSEGGFLVPQEYTNGMYDAAVEASVLLPRVRVFRMQSDTLHLNSFSGMNHTSSLFGGFEGGWEQELGTVTAQSFKTRRLTFAAKKLIILQQSSNELVQDGSDFERLLYEALATAMAYKLDEAIIGGSGAGQPLGITAASSTITASKVASQTADTIWWKNVIDMMTRLAPGCWNNAVWLCHPSCISQLFRLDAHADYGSGSALIADTIQPAFSQTNGTFTLLGRPVLVTEKCEKLGDLGDIILCDPSQYALGMRQELVIDRSMHAGFSSDSMYYRAKIRVDGQPLWADALTPRNDTTTLSWAVMLEAR